MRSGKSRSLQPNPPSAADASYFLGPQEVTKKRCRATSHVLRLLAQPPVRCPAFLATNGRFRTRPFGRSGMRNRTAPFAAAILGGGAGTSRAEKNRDIHRSFG